MNYNEAAQEAEEMFGHVRWELINWNEDGPDVDTDDLSREESDRYQQVAFFVWHNTKNDEQ